MDFTKIYISITIYIFTKIDIVTKINISPKSTLAALPLPGLLIQLYYCRATPQGAEGALRKHALYQHTNKNLRNPHRAHTRLTKTLVQGREAAWEY